MGAILASNFMQNIKKIVGAVFQKISIYHHFGPFWAILGHFGTVRPDFSRTGIFSEKPLDTILAIIVRNLGAKDE